MIGVGRAIDWTEAVAGALDDPLTRPAGGIEPHYDVSPEVTVSRDHGLAVYHLADNQLGHGSSLGNARVWAETRGTGSMLNLFSIETGTRVLGGMAATYHLPFSDLSLAATEARHDVLARAMPSSRGTVHLHPAYQQRELVIGDGLHCLETFFVPRTGMDDPAVGHFVVALRNRTAHPLSITVVVSLDLRGATSRDVEARFDSTRGALVAHNASEPRWVRVFGASMTPVGYVATTDEEAAYSPRHRLPSRVDGPGDLTGALQFDVLILPRQCVKLRVAVAFSPRGEDEALRVYDAAQRDGHALRRTIDHYASVLQTALVEMPDALLTQGVQWAKACLLRPLSRYAVADAVTNDPGNSSQLVGRDTAWYVYGCDFVLPDESCGMLRAFARHQRPDGLITETVHGLTSETEDHGFNVNDNTPLWVLAVAHHVEATGHTDCLRDLYEPVRLATELILRERDQHGLVRCTADGIGIKGICGWRNILRYEQITGAVTEINAECYGALCAAADLADAAGRVDDAVRYRAEARRLRSAINEHLRNPDTGTYVRNVDLAGRVFTQATIDLVFPLIFGVADAETARAVRERLARPDFMTAGGIRALPEQNPRYDPSAEVGLVGGVWPGATWWYAMTHSEGSSRVMVDSLRRSYWHYVADPRVYNTVPGQFSEWSDGQTLVNRGQRLSPWEAPRFLWATIEGLVGLNLRGGKVALHPRLPPDWRWLRVHNLPVRGGRLSCFLVRQADGLHAYTPDRFEGDAICHRYDQELTAGVETITTGLSATAFRSGGEVLICLGNILDSPILGPFLAHHALDRRARYRVERLSNADQEWRELGTIAGEELQQLTTRLDAMGYALYRFVPDP